MYIASYKYCSIIIFLKSQYRPINNASIYIRNCNYNCNISTGSPLSKLIFSGALHIHTNIHKTKLVATY